MPSLWHRETIRVKAGGVTNAGFRPVVQDASFHLADTLGMELQLGPFVGSDLTVKRANLGQHLVENTALATVADRHIAGVLAPENVVECVDGVVVGRNGHIAAGEAGHVPFAVLESGVHSQRHPTERRALANTLRQEIVQRLGVVAGEHLGDTTFVGMAALVHIQAAGKYTMLPDGLQRAGHVVQLEVELSTSGVEALRYTAVWYEHKHRAFGCPPGLLGHGRARPGQGGQWRRKGGTTEGFQKLTSIGSHYKNSLSYRRSVNVCNWVRPTISSCRS